MSVAITTPATAYPVTLAEAKDHCRVDGADEDTEITGLIIAAVKHVENYCGRSFTVQTLTMHLDKFEDEIHLPRGPVTVVSSVRYFDEANTLQTLSASVYQADIISIPATVSLAHDQQWPSIYKRKNAVQIAYTVGGQVDDDVKLAMLLLISQWHAGRAAASDKPMTDIPNGAAALLANHRSYAF